MIQGSWGGYSSGSDDATSIYEEEEEVVSTVPGITKPGSPTVTYPIKMLDHGSTYGKVLYDVEGNALKDQSGKYLNIWTTAMKDAFAEGKLRAIHNLKEPSYRYFVTSQKQQQRFQTHRDSGAPRKVLYHVYLDDDIDRTSVVFRNTFISKSKKCS